MIPTTPSMGKKVILIQNKGDLIVSYHYVLLSERVNLHHVFWQTIVDLESWWNAHRNRKEFIVIFHKWGIFVIKTNLRGVSEIYQINGVMDGHKLVKNDTVSLLFFSFFITGCPGQFVHTSTNFRALKVTAGYDPQWSQDLKCLNSMGIEPMTSWRS